ncbi:MAG: GUN4 domain-containing protein [Xenococcaceae cyanobacterium]
MSEQPSKPTKPSVNEQIADVLVKVLVTGSGSFSLYYLVAEDIAKAIIAGGVAFGASSMTNFWKGFGNILNPDAQKVGEEAGKVVERTITDIASKIMDFPSLYREALKTYCYSVEVEGFQNLPGLPLKDVFVPLRIESAQSRLLAESPKEIWEFLPHTRGNFPHRRIAVVAAPGYGKTTLMRHLAYVYVTNPPNNTPHFIPILLRFREIYDLIPVGKSPEGKKEKFPDLSALILQHLAKQPAFHSLKPSRQWFENNLKQGKCLVMLDGLDEVPKGAREALREWVDRQMKAYGNTQFILTSRPHGFELKADEPSYPIQIDSKLRVLDFTNDQKEDFINQWYRTYVWTQKWERLWQTSQHNWEPDRLSEEQARIRSDSEAAKSAKNLTAQMFSQASLNDLARNPLLITMIAATHNANIELPKRRVELYEEICKLLLGTRPFAQTRKLTLTATQNKRVLQVLAWHLMEAEITQFSREQGSEWIGETLTRCCKESSLTSADFFLEMLETAGLLLEKELGQYEFTHQTFQEYFAALHLKEMGQEGLEILLQKLNNDRWQEVICFYAALGNADPLIAAILDNPTAENLKLANRCKNEGLQVSPKMVERLNQVVEEAHLDSSASVRLEQRFCNLTLIDDKTAISSPITWGEYQLFLEAQEIGQFHSTAEIRQISPEQENQPVTEISPKDARWFCAWLATQASLQSEDAVYAYRLPTTEELQKVSTGGGLIRKTPSPDRLGNALLCVRVQLPNRYRALLNYLANGRWRNADEETAKVMLEVAGKKEQGYLDIEDIEKFPCEDLRILDQLWKNFSGSLFGFSVQKDIYQSLGGTREYDKKIWYTFSERVGWRKGENWVKYSDLTFNLKAMVGHLPLVALRGIIVVVGEGGGVVGVSLLSRTDL